MSKQAWHFGAPECDPAVLAEESARRRAEAALKEWARRPLSNNPINNPLTSGLRAPAHQRAAFLEQLSRCGSVLEAALRAGGNHGTVYCRKAKDPDFARRWADAIRRHAEEVGDDVALQAN